MEKTAMPSDSLPGGLSPKPATFAGRLNLSTFEFGGASPRRSPRLLGTTTTSTTSTLKSTKHSPSPSPQKRKSHHPDPQPTLASSSSSSTTTSKKRPKPSSLKKKSPTKKNTPTSYAPPSTYAHLPLLPDAIAPNLLVLFIGLNPGIQTARTGHAYAHPSNLFWKLLASSNVTPRIPHPSSADLLLYPHPCRPEDDHLLPRRYSLGLTNIVARPSRNGAELSREEMDRGVEVLAEKVRRFRPESVCVVGKSIWESFWRVRMGRALGKGEFRYGWQGVAGKEDRFGEVVGEGGQVVWEGARVFVATSTSGLAASMRPAEKEAVWRELGEWVERRRVEREREREVGGKEEKVEESGEDEDGEKKQDQEEEEEEEGKAEGRGSSPSRGEKMAGFD